MQTKKICFIILALMASTVLAAQSTSYGIKFGIGAGAMFDRVTPSLTKEMQSEIDYTTNARFSYSANLSLMYKSAGFWGVTFEPGFIQKGWANPATNSTGDAYDVVLNYLQMPVLADLYLNDKLSFSVGPEFAYLFRETEIMGQDKKHNEAFNKFALAAVLGANYALAPKIDCGIRVCSDLLPIFNAKLINNQGELLDNKFKMFNQYAQVYLRFRTN